MGYVSLVLQLILIGFFCCLRFLHGSPKLGSRRDKAEWLSLWVLTGLACFA